MPLEFLDTTPALVCYFLNEKVNDLVTNDITIQVFQVYFRLFAATNLIESVPIQKVELWLTSLLKLFESTSHDTLLTHSKEIFEKLIKKCVKQMLMAESYDCLNSFVDNLLEIIPGQIGNLKFLAVAHLTIIQILENISKVNWPNFDYFSMKLTNIQIDWSNYLRKLTGKFLSLIFYSNLTKLRLNLVKLEYSPFFWI